MPKKLPPTKTAAKPARFGASGLLAEVRGLILSARESVARITNAALTLLYWEVGHRIRVDVLNEKRADYGEQIVQTLSAQLEVEFGRGFSRRNLFSMVAFAETFPDRKIVQTLSAQLGWSHFKEIIPQQEELKRDFYAEMCRIERWSSWALANPSVVLRIPTGFRPKAQGCEARATLGQRCVRRLNRNAVAALPRVTIFPAFGQNPVGVWRDLPAFTQGSFATLGWRPKSRWDLLKPAPFAYPPSHIEHPAPRLPHSTFRVPPSALP